MEYLPDMMTMACLASQHMKMLRHNKAQHKQVIEKDYKAIVDNYWVILFYVSDWLSTECRC